MSKNKDFFTALSDSHALVNKANTEQRDRALDALLTANPADPTAFRLAISSHKIFWDTYNTSLMAASRTTVRGRSNAPAPNYYNSDTFLSPLTPSDPYSFSKLHQLAAQQRVMLGLKTAEENVLIGILVHNPAECRAYLAARASLGDLTQIYGWEPNEVVPVVQPPQTIPPHAKNTSTKVLTDPAIASIKNQASELLLGKLIGQSNNHIFLTSLLGAVDKPELDRAAISLGFPATGTASLSLGLIIKIKGVIEARITKLKQDDAKVKFTEYVHQRTPEELLSDETLLKKDNPNFKLGLPPLYADLAENEVDWAKGILGDRFLHAYLPAHKTKEALLIALNVAADPALMKAELKKLIGPHDYIDHAVTAENLNAIRTSMIQRIISQASSEPEQKAVRALVNAKDLVAFKKGLQTLGVSQLGWITESNFGKMKQWACSRIFQIQIANTSSLGADAYPQLLKAFNQFSLDKQIQILKKSSDLRHILKAQDLDTLSYYFGKEASADLVTENKNRVSFNAIHNAAVANILANFKPLIKLNSLQVDEINTALMDLDPIIPNDLVRYKPFITAIKAQCGAVNEANFDAAFGLSADGNTFTNPSVREAINRQHEMNQSVFAAYNLDENEKHKKLLSLILSLEKNHPLTDQQINLIRATFNSSDSAQEFIQLLIPKLVAPNNAHSYALKLSLTNELTSVLFNEIKIEVNKGQLSNRNAEVVYTRIDKMTDQLTILQDNQNQVTKNKDQFKFIADIDPIHLFNPAFQGKAKLEALAMKTQYQELSNDCDLVVDQLKRNKATLVDHLHSLPKIADIRAGSGVRHTIAELRYELKVELKKVESNLQNYVKVQNNLSGEDGILKAIDDAAVGRKNYVYKVEGITCQSYFSDAIPPLPTGPIVMSANPTVATTSGVGKILNFIFEDNIPQNMVRVFDVPHEIDSSSVPSGKLQTFGRFTERHSETNPTPRAILKDGESTKIPTGTFEILQFPKTSGQARVDLTAAKVNFSMAMAAQILASMDAPPTKDNPIRLRGSNREELAYLWTALIVLGKKSTKMAFDSDAIDVESSVFLPSNEKGTLWGFNSESLYETVFKDKEYHASINQKVEALHKVSEAKFGHEKDKKQAEQLMGLFKTELKSVKDQAKKTIEEDGPARSVKSFSV